MHQHYTPATQLHNRLHNGHSTNPSQPQAQHLPSFMAMRSSVSAAASSPVCTRPHALLKPSSKLSLGLT